MSNESSVRNERMTHLLGKFWTVANLLSLIRLLLALPLAYLILIRGSFHLVMVLLVVGIATDWFDGRVARWSNTVSEWGKVLDPVADKVAALFITLALVARDSLPLWFFVLVIFRDICIVLGGIALARRTSHVVMSLWMGKVAVTALTVTVLAALLEADPDVMNFCVYVTAGLFVYSFLLYLVRFVRLMRTGSDRDTGADSDELPELAQAENS